MSGKVKIDWLGVNERGEARGARGSYTLAEVAAVTELYYKRGWRSLTVLAGTGPLGGEDQREVARIGPHPDTGKRTWWAEGGKDAR